MEHYFEIPIMYKNEELLFNGRLTTFAYDYKFYININGREVVFEQDDEAKLRAIVPDRETTPTIDKELIERIGEVLESLHAVR